MTADQRLDQIEPVLAELLAKQDHTDKKVDRLTDIVLNISQVLNKQSDNVSFLLKNQLQMSGQIENIEITINTIETRLDTMDGGLDKMDDKFDKLDDKFDKMDDKFGKMDGKFGKMAETQNSILSILLSK
ncbi:hypothetical protein [Dyadobacter fanqingshengii]|uniref:t-SNARE coiled-coil homology domain-containing protein n=1 Tax=Dyadobacter fanqingshengii TaxID=2906443 RepID=A0A9X1P718_9BACT|nr:hypothetical protein [Dyadobacter fanqingshengii]MCF0039931.1 hypothetical protein [Dyadobacter fanqingshengii]USJ38311.1 hypothetical protein NFI81_11110 [Dyadobacter fanqingshengii]